MDQLADYYHSVETYVVSTVSADLPNVREAVNRLWQDLSLHAPNLRIPALATPPPPPPPPTPPLPERWLSQTAEWASEHKRTVSVIGVGIVGAGLLAGYSAVNASRDARARMGTASTTERRQVIVVLGGDHPLALPLVLGLERQGFIVVVSVESPEDVQLMENNCHGYVRALVLDPADPDSVPFFLRSLASALSRRFPINAAGDPHVSSASQPYVHSVISLLSLPGSSTAATPPALAPLEHLSLQTSYLPYLQATNLTPLQVIQSLLPVLRSSPARSRDKGQRSVVFCVSAADARGGGAFSGPRSMSAVATLKAIDVLRQEVSLVSASASTEHAASMKQVHIVTAHVGAVTKRRSGGDVITQNVSSDVREWTPSEQSTYGEAFAKFTAKVHQRNVAPHATHVDAFVRQMTDIVTGTRPSSPTAVSFGLWKMRNWLRSDHVYLGAGARTYALASGLPPFVLDALLNLPIILLGIRNALLPIQPYIRRPSTPPPAVQRPAPVRQLIEAAPESEFSEGEGTNSNHSSQASGAEADVESNTEHDSGAEQDSPEARGDQSMTSSWVSLSA